MPKLSKKQADETPKGWHVIQIHSTSQTNYAVLRDVISIEKRYLTSDLSILSWASLTLWMGMTSTSAVRLCLPQKSSIS